VWRAPYFERKETMDTNRAEEVILGEIEGLINEIADLFEELSQASFDNEEDYWRASRAVTEVGSLVCGAYGRLLEQDKA